MTSKEAYEKTMSRYEAIARDEVRPPTKGTCADVISEAERLARVAEKDRAVFNRLAGADLFDMDNVDLLGTTALSVHYAEAQWTIFSNPEKDPETAAKLERAPEVRSDLLLDLDFVEKKFNPPGLSAALSEVREGSSKRDLLQDLVTLSALCETHADALSKIGHDTDVAAEASALCADLSKVLGADKEETARAKDIRDRAVTLVERMCGEVRAAGRFLFRKDPDRLSEYRNLILK